MKANADKANAKNQSKKERDAAAGQQRIYTKKNKTINRYQKILDDNIIALTQYEAQAADPVLNGQIPEEKRIAYKFVKAQSRNARSQLDLLKGKSTGKGKNVKPVPGLYQ